MSIAVVGGEGSACIWRGTYDDVAHSVTLTGSGPGRCTVVLEQADGKRAAVQFVQQSGRASVPMPVPPEVVPTLAVAPVVVTIPPGGTGQQTFSPITLHPIPPPPSKPTAVGSFYVIGAASDMG